MCILVISFSAWISFETHAAERPKLYTKDNVLAAGIYNNAATSSDLSLIIRADVGGETIFDEGYEIGYIIPKKDIKGWNEVGFDASDWLLGRSGIGYADSDDNTTVPAGTLSVYTRYYFDVPNAKSAKEINFFVDYDDAFILWLNGVEVARSQNIENVAPGKVPGWNEPIGKIVDHEATILAAGRPNSARWDRAEGWGQNQIAKPVVECDFGGDAQKGVGAKPTGEGTGGGNKASLFLRDNVLAAVNFNDAASSSDMTLILRLTGDGTIYVDEGSSVKYITDPDSNTPDDWINSNFNDKDWENGISGVGFSDGDDNTVTNTGLISIFTRYHFDAPDADKIKELVLLADFDDSFIVWLNGVNISAGGNAPAGDPPAWDASKVAGTVSNHEASILAAGKPNKARWDNGLIQKTTVSFKYAGSSANPVSPAGKLTSTWGKIKKM
jgi:hypothetical protein